MRTWVFDLDGTICTQERMGTYQNALPRKKVIEKMDVLKIMGDRIVIFTARGMCTFKGDIELVEKNMRPLTEKWLKDNNVPYDELILGKPLGDVYVDDKGMHVDDFAKDEDV